jgi:RNase P subunit RPR2
LKKEESLPQKLLKKLGYTKQTTCNSCGTFGKYPEQLQIVYLDGDQLNATKNNVQTYCLNCSVELSYSLKAKKKSAPKKTPTPLEHIKPTPDY